MKVKAIDTGSRSRVHIWRTHVLAPLSITWPCNDYDERRRPYSRNYRFKIRKNSTVVIGLLCSGENVSLIFLRSPAMQM